jgi:hypothetical protein
MASSFPGHHAYGFLLLGLRQGQGLCKKVNDVIELRHRIEQAVASITLDMIHGTWSEISYRLDILRATRGAHIEVN